MALCVLFIAAFVWLTGAFGLMLGVLRPNFQWTSEAMPIKQSMNVMISILLGFGLPILAAVGCYLLRTRCSTEVYLALTWWLDTKGAARFDAL